MLFTTVSFAQNNLSGKLVTSVTDKPLAGATLYITDLKIGTSTQGDGSYQLLHIPKGQYLTEVSMVGCAHKASIIKIDKQVIQNFSLDESLNELQEVVITGTSAGTERRSSPTPITKVPNSYPQQKASTNIINTIPKIPGVSGITDGPGITKPVIRGMGYH